MQATILVGTALVAGSPRACGEPAEAAAIERPEIGGRRIVKHFDFDEKRFGNFDPTPMNWRRHEAPGFASFLEGQFDETFGHAAPPSFRLGLNGASIGYTYLGRDIAVRTESDYLIVAWVRTESLKTARAYFTANYLDRKGVPIAGTRRQSPLLASTEGWSPLVLGMPGGVEGARYIGISLWLTQASVWDSGPRSPRNIESEDIEGTAWFDDVTIYRLPQVSLGTSSPGNVFGYARPATLLARVTDPDGLNLTAELRVRGADGRVVLQHSVPVAADDTDQSIVLESLPVGHYEAELIASSIDRTELVRRRLQFVKLAEATRASAGVGGGFGIVLKQAGPDILDAQRALLDELRPSYVKLPVWRAASAVVEGPRYEPGVGACIESCRELGAQPVGVMVADLTTSKSRGEVGVRTLMDLLSDDPSGWKPLVVGVWSSYAMLMSHWQLGEDHDRTVYLDPRLGAVVESLRGQMEPVMVSSKLVTPASALYEPNEVTSDYKAVYLPADVPADEVERAVLPFVKAHPGRVWLTVEPLAADVYDREARLADLARRICEAKFQDVDTVFMDAAWTVHADTLSLRADPSEDYLIFRTVSDLLGGTKPVSRTRISGQAEGLVFDHGGRSVMFVWDEYAPPEGREHILLLGEDTFEVDLWGRRTSLASIGSKQVVRIGPMPKYIVGAPTWLMEFRRQFAIAPAIVEADYDAGAQQVIFRNTFSAPISGMLRLVPPPDWDVRPDRFMFTLQPDEAFAAPVQIRFPANAQARVTPLVGAFDIDADRRYRVTTPAWFELGLEGIDMSTYVYRKGSRVIVSQSMTNRTEETINFRGAVVAPGRPRVYRQFLNFEPGQTARKEFILENGEELSGQLIRVALKELQGTRVWNTVVRVP